MAWHVVPRAGAPRHLDRAWSTASGDRRARERQRPRSRTDVAPPKQRERVGAGRGNHVRGGVRAVARAATASGGAGQSSNSVMAHGWELASG